MNDEEQLNEMYMRFCDLHHMMVRIVEDYNQSGFSEPGEIQKLQTAVINVGYVAMQIGLSTVAPEKEAPILHSQSATGIKNQGGNGE